VIRKWENPGAGFKEKNHIQICVRNRNCIKGYFLPREKAADIYPDSVLFRQVTKAVNRKKPAKPLNKSIALKPN